MCASESWKYVPAQFLFQWSLVQVVSLSQHKVQVFLEPLITVTEQGSVPVGVFVARLFSLLTPSPSPSASPSARHSTHR